MYRDGRELLNKVPGLQKDYFETMPPHMRGELWSATTPAASRAPWPRSRIYNRYSSISTMSPALTSVCCSRPLPETEIT
jgi:hypothetical protein